ncbi:MAG: HAMP domain-containing histidine kinase [Campylobacteraceae bacterium]|nr:HAMP domain-containing histidine kinase [Campylobacteraceae bacterium]
MVIVLTKDEKRTFYSFLSLYLGSSFLLILIIAWLFYFSSARQYRELAISKMQINSTNITHQIIQAHMQNNSIDFINLKVDKGLKFGLYDSAEKPIYTQVKDKIDFSKIDYKTKDAIFYISHGVSGHLGVSYVVIKKTGFEKQLSQLLKKIIEVVISAYILIALIGFYLAKLFIYPIQTQRKKLNLFIKNATHELNTPISALLLCIGSENFYNEKNRNLMRISAKKISNLYKDLAYITIKEHQKKRLFLQDVSIILKKELKYHTSLAEKKKINLTYSLEETFLKIDEEDFIRLTNNLISNAIKYTKRNGRISVVLKDKTLIIEDAGIGIAREKLDKIFKRYYRATQSVGGFGIGLDIVYSICRIYDIKIQVNSKINEGTSFTLNF